jgi:hypothetical protein
MAIVGVTITKETPFRNSVQAFSNMYFYNNGTGGVPSESGALAMIDELVAIERGLHASTIEFVFARLWHQTLLAATSNMIAQKSLTGNGTLSPDSTLDKERAYLFRWRAGQDSRGNPVYLRKWYHSCAVFPGGPALTATIYSNSGGFTQAQRDSMEANVADVATLASGGGGWELCAKSGRALTQGTTPDAHPYLEHHQLGDMWRGA